jgi:aspartate dehydrogenase
MLRCLALRGAADCVAGVMVRPAKVTEITARTAGRFPVVGSLDALLDQRPDLVIEAAGQPAAKELTADVLRRGHDILLASVGALADADFAATLTGLLGPADVLIAAGAVAGLDGLLAARTAGLSSVTYTSVKPPHAWRGTAGEMMVDAARCVTLFEGTARQAAQKFPQNANVGATIALASLGLDRTRVVLVSDPAVAGPLGIIEAQGAFGHFRFDILALASPTNPKTSAITGHSLISAALDGMCFGLADRLEPAR